MTSLGARLLVLGFSAAAHAALLAPLGHAAPSQGATDDAVSVDLLTEVTPPREAQEPEPSPASPAGHASWPTHTHVYPVPHDHDATPHDPNLVHVPALPAAHEHPAAATPAETATDDPPHFEITVGAANDAHGVVSASGTAPSHEDDAPVLAASVDAQARLVRGQAPGYPDAARAEGVEGDVQLELVVSLSGSVETARVVRGIGHGLDEAALRAAHQFRFAPAIRAGRAVRVRMGWSVQFRLR